ncbi:MAG: hypothetical protein Q8Q37_02030 [bacterium]|nr:hypothetical protein [bacterium]
MVAQTNPSLRQKARFLDLMGSVLELFKAGKRNPDQLCQLLQLIKDSPNWYAQLFASVLPTKEDIQRQLSEWGRLYAEVFKFKNVNFSQLPIPTPPPGITRLFVGCNDLKTSQIFNVLGQKMPTATSYDDLDTIQSVAKRPLNKFYAIWARDRVEADEELKNLSANDIKKRGINTLNLQERLLYELKYFLETNGQHLDVMNWTLCAGSRDTAGDVPGVCWNDDRLEVSWSDPVDAEDGPRARQAVS